MKVEVSVKRPISTALLVTSLAFPALALPSIDLAPVAEVPGQVTSITHAGDGRLFVTTLDGRVWIIQNGAVLPQPFLDIRNRVGTSIVQGLLSIAFHPNFASNGFFFVNYTAPGNNLVTARYRVSATPSMADATSERILLSIPNPLGAHNGGALAFGPDGLLYISTGDGGPPRDPLCSGQSTSSLLGKVLRLDPNRNTNTSPFYGVPPSNPFVGPGNPPDEIWALGLRNPWRITFDRGTGDLFLADVGENEREEVNRQRASAGGGQNYGWKVLEGTFCVNDGSGCTQPLLPCNSPTLTRPVIEYDHGRGDCSVTGGYVYRGSGIPGLQGAYVFGDFCSGILRGAVEQGSTFGVEEFLPTLAGVTTFGEDAAGELYAAAGGSIVKLVPGEAAGPCVPSPERLCLQGGRFAVTASFQTPQGHSGAGHPIGLTGDSGYFWFFSANNAELFVKVLDACAPPFDRFWFFGAGLTNVEVQITVTDTEAGNSRHYLNPQGRAFAPIQDTQAFATCP